MERLAFLIISTQIDMQIYKLYDGCCKIIKGL